MYSHTQRPSVFYKLLAYTQNFSFLSKAYNIPQCQNIKNMYNYSFVKFLKDKPISPYLITIKK